jgi:hypothetical protein
MPVKDPTAAMVEAELAHVPPLVASVSVMVDPAHKVLLPLMAAGDAVTVTTL